MKPHVAAELDRVLAAKRDARRHIREAAELEVQAIRWAINVEHELGYEVADKLGLSPGWVSRVASGKEPNPRDDDAV